MKARFLLTAVSAGLVCGQGLAATPPTAANPWAKVPALPTACYSQQDSNWAAADPARDALNAEIERQKNLNAKVREKFENIDPFEKAQRMTQYLMDNPEAGAAYMQQAYAAGQNVTEDIQDWGESLQAINEDEDALLARYEAARTKAYAPGEARRLAMVKRAEREGASLDGEGVPDWAIIEMESIRRQWQTAYEAFCPAWWGPTGEMQAFTKRLKNYLVQEEIPRRQSTDDELVKQFEMMGTPAGSFRSTAAMEGVVQYLDKVQPLYGNRNSERDCPPAPDHCRM